jgi:signal recognition particle GTPase
VYGFSFEKKEWCKYFVDQISNVDWKPNALASLILPAPQKRLLQGLVTGHKFPDKARNEYGLKGKGLVILLHGSPGSGKTLTAGKLRGSSRAQARLTRCTQK